MSAPVAHGGAPRGWLEFSASLNPCGTPPAVRAAVARAGYGAYADLDPREAELHLAEDAGVAATCVLLTAGATEALRLAVRAFGEPSGRAAVLGPTYGEYSRLAAMHGIATVEVRAHAPDFAPPVELFAGALAAERLSLAVVCDPNNPTGRRLTADALGAICDALPPGAVLVIDQSFAAFSDEPLCAAELTRRPNVILVRSLTKLLAAPGIRAGYVIGPAELVAALRGVRDPWSPGAHAIAAAGAASWHIDPALRGTLAAWRSRLARALGGLGLPTVPSDAPFLLAHAGPRAGGLLRSLAAERIAVRWCASFGLSEHVRLAVRPPEEQDALLRALMSARAEVGW